MKARMVLPGAIVARSVFKAVKEMHGVWKTASVLADRSEESRVPLNNGEVSTERGLSDGKVVQEVNLGLGIRARL